MSGASTSTHQWVEVLDTRASRQREFRAKTTWGWNVDSTSVAILLPSPLFSMTSVTDTSGHRILVKMGFALDERSTLGFMARKPSSV